MITYSIAEWDSLYENHETRKRKTLFWVLVPNGHDSLGFCEIMERDDGLEVFGAWNLILQMASRCSTRGQLVNNKGRPYSARDIAKKSRSREASIENALGVLVEVGWLAAEGENDPQPKPKKTRAGRAAESAATPARSADTSGESADTSGESAATPADRAATSAESADIAADRAGGSGSKKERKKERKTPLPPKGGKGEGGDVPDALNTEKFRIAWARWESYLTESGKPLTATRRKVQLEALAEKGEDGATTALVTAMMRGFQAPARVDSSAKGKAPAPDPDPDLDEAKRDSDEAIAKAMAMAEGKG
jgi:hypothetical protein